MKPINTLRFIIIISIFLLFNCKGPKGPQGDPAPKEVTTLSGNVLQFLSGPYRVSNFKMDHHYGLITVSGGSLVTVENTEYSAVTDSNGSFLIRNMPVGTYNIKISKDGFGDIRLFGIKAYKSDVPVEVNQCSFAYSDYCAYSSQNSIHSIGTIIDSIVGLGYYNSNVELQLYATINNFNKKRLFESLPSDIRDFVFFFSKDPEVSNTNHDINLHSRDIEPVIVQWDYNIPKKDTIARFMIELQDLYAKYKKGDKIYVVGHGANYYVSSGDYYDPFLKKNIWTSVSKEASTICSFILP